MDEKQYKISRMRQHYYDRYESFQYQMMIIAGGTLTVFISINKDTPIDFFYKYGFIALGISLIFGVLSMIFLQTHLLLFAELDTIDNQLKDKTNKEKDSVDLIKKLLKKEYLIEGNFIFGFIHFLSFLLGLILIVIGLIKS